MGIPKPFVILQVRLRGYNCPFWLLICLVVSGMALTCADSRLSELVAELEEASIDTHWPSG